MLLIKSLIFGSEGTYEIFGMNVAFECAQNSSKHHISQLETTSYASQIVITCLNSRSFRLLTQGYLHVFVHEMSHAIAHRTVSQPSRVEIYVDSCTGRTIALTFNENESQSSAKVKAVQTYISAAGTIGNIAFSVLKVIAALKLKNWIGRPIASILIAGSVVWIAGELFYSCVSATTKNSGDFGQIANLGRPYLFAASAILVGEVALAALCCARFF